MILATLLVFVDLLLFILNALIIIRIVTTWLAPEGKLPRFRQVLADLTEPVIAPVRQLMRSKGTTDFAPAATLLIFIGIRIALYYLIFSR